MARVATAAFREEHCRECRAEKCWPIVRAVPHLGGRGSKVGSKVGIRSDCSSECSSEWRVGVWRWVLCVGFCVLGSVCWVLCDGLRAVCWGVLQPVAICALCVALLRCVLCAACCVLCVVLRVVLCCEVCKMSL